MLTDKQAGVMGAIGFTALGGVLGGIIPCVSAFEKVNNAPFLTVDFIALAVFFASSAASLICLIAFFWTKSQNKSLKDEIRTRGKPEASPSPFSDPAFRFHGRAAQADLS